VRLVTTDVVRSPDSPERLRLVGEITYGVAGWSPERWWFEVADEYAPFLSRSGNPWLGCLLPLAAKIGEPLHIARPVDRRLFQGAHEILRVWASWYPEIHPVPIVWASWYPEIHPVPIEAAALEDAPAGNGGRTGAFFSGGVDSFFTVLHHADTERDEGRRPIDDLIWVRGLDIPLARREAGDRMYADLREAARELDKELVEIRTNARETRLETADWACLTHGCVTIASGLALEARYARLLVSSSRPYRRLREYGSHPLTDALLSTGRTQVVHYGCGYTRVEKTARVGRSAASLARLHVCWKGASETNCGRCQKCYKTMAALDLLGVLDHCRTLDVRRYSVERLGRVYFAEEYRRYAFEEIRALAKRLGRHDVVRAINRAFRRTDRIQRWLPAARRLDGLLERAGVVRNRTRALERLLLRGCIL